MVGMGRKKSEEGTFRYLRTGRDLFPRACDKKRITWGDFSVLQRGLQKTPRPFGRPSTSPLGKDSQGLNTDGMSPAVSRSKAAAICLIVSQFKLRFDLDTGKFKLFKRVFSVQSNTWQNLLWCPFPLRFKSIKDAAQGIFL